MTGREPRRWYDVTRAAVGDKATIRIYGDIGESWWDDSAVSADSFAKDLDEIGPVGQIELHINSPGGVAFDGVTILNLLRDHPATVTVYVDGLAASAASIIAMAGDEVVMGRGAQMMIHDASIFSWGNADQLRKDAELLDSLSTSMAEVYAERAGGTAGSWRDTMRAETWYTASEAVEAGLADRTSKDSGDGDATDVAAMLRRSPAAAKFRYQGRAQAPAPRTPARAGGQETQGGAVAHEITDEDFAALRDKLGLGEDATISDVLEAVQAQDTGEGENDTEGSDQEELVTASLPKGVKAIDESVLADLRAKAELGVQAHAAQQKARREGLVTAALKAGKIRAADKQRWLKNLELDPEGYEATLDALEPGLVPVTELGYDGGSVEDDGPASLEAVRGSAAYTNWKVV